MKIKKYISHDGTTIEKGFPYLEEIVITLDIDNSHLKIITNNDVYLKRLEVGDWLGLLDGSGRVIKTHRFSDETIL